MNKPAAQLDTANVSQDTHPMADLLRMDRMPHIWCSSCGLGTGLTCFIMALRDTGIPEDDVAVVSGIGCTGRVAGYLNLDSFHTTHGRAIPFATGLALSNLGRRRHRGHRREPLHSLRAPEHGPSGDLCQQLHLWHDRRTGGTDDSYLGQGHHGAVRELRLPVQYPVSGDSERGHLCCQVDIASYEKA